MTTQTKKSYLRDRRFAGTGEIERLVLAGYSVNTLTPYQFRINKVLDVFPTNRKFHHIPTNTRGTYTDLVQLCERFSA